MEGGGRPASIYQIEKAIKKPLRDTARGVSGKSLKTKVRQDHSEWTQLTHQQQLPLSANPKKIQGLKPSSQKERKRFRPPICYHVNHSQHQNAKKEKRDQKKGEVVLSPQQGGEAANEQ